MPQKKRILVLPAAAIIILTACLWRLNNPPPTQAEMDLPGETRQAPAFQLYDQNSKLLKLAAYLGRHRIVIVFYDGQAGPDADPVLQELRKFYPALKAESVVVLGISTALPQENRNNSAQPYPFPLLSDAVAADKNSVHTVWGRLVPPASLDKPAGTKPAVFLIDRKGHVPWSGDLPAAEADTRSLISRLLR